MTEAELDLTGEFGNDPPHSSGAAVATEALYFFDLTAEAPHIPDPHTVTLFVIPADDPFPNAE